MTEDSDQDHKAVNGAAEKATENASESETVAVDMNFRTEQNAEDVKSSIAETPLDKSPDSMSDSKKRKISPVEADERDWRVRRKEDQTFERRQDSGWRGRGGFRGRASSLSYKNNIKSEFLRPESQDPDEIRKQVEFYFSDSNLPTDRYLLEQTGGSKNRPVPIKVIHKFKRMRHFQPFSAVVSALRESELLDVNEKEEVSRKIALPDDVTIDPTANFPQNLRAIDDKTRSRTIYAKGFGEEGSKTQLDIEAFFAPYGPTNAIRLRRQYPEQTFKGSVWVEFDSDETAQRFLALEPKPKWDERDLLIMSKDAYVEAKQKDILEGKIIKHPKREGDRERGTYRGWEDRGRGDRGRGDRDRGDRGRGDRGRGDRGRGDRSRGHRGRADRGGSRGRGRGYHSRDGENRKRDAEEPGDKRNDCSDSEAERSKVDDVDSTGNAGATEKADGTTSAQAAAEELSDSKGKKRARDTEDEDSDKGNGEGPAEELDERKDAKRTKVDLEDVAKIT